MGQAVSPAKDRPPGLTSWPVAEFLTTLPLSHSECSECFGSSGGAGGFACQGQASWTGSTSPNGRWRLGGQKAVGQGSPAFLTRADLCPWAATRHPANRSPAGIRLHLPANKHQPLIAPATSLCRHAIVTSDEQTLAAYTPAVPPARHDATQCEYKTAQPRTTGAGPSAPRTQHPEPSTGAQKRPHPLLFSANLFTIIDRRPRTVRSASHHQRWG